MAKTSTKTAMVSGVLAFVKAHKEMKGRDAIDIAKLEVLMNEWALGKKKAAAAVAAAAGTDPKPKRAKTGYLLFSQEKRPTVSDVPARERMSALAALWKALSDEERAEWNARAKALAPKPVPDVVAADAATSSTTTDEDEGEEEDEEDDA